MVARSPATANTARAATSLTVNTKPVAVHCCAGRLPAPHCSILSIGVHSHQPGPSFKSLLRQDQMVHACNSLLQHINDLIIAWTQQDQASHLTTLPTGGPATDKQSRSKEHSMTGKATHSRERRLEPADCTGRQGADMCDHDMQTLSLQAGEAVAQLQWTSRKGAGMSSHGVQPLI